MDTLGHTLTALIPAFAGVGIAVLIRFAGTWISLWELRASQRILFEAIESQRKAAGATQVPSLTATGETPPDRTLAALERVAAALELQAQHQARGGWEQFINFLAQAAIVVGAVVALAALLRR
jgi:hypothetical protein